MEVSFKTKFKIGQSVWHITKESQEGIVIDIIYYTHTRQVAYVIALGFDNEVTCVERELSESKIF